MLRAAQALRYLISETAELRSDAPLRCFEPFALGAQSKQVRLGIKAVIGGRIYDYEVQFERAKFTSERLLWLRTDGEVTLLHRTGQDVAGEWTEDEQFTLLSKVFRPNALLLSLADRLAPALAGDIAVGIRRLLKSFGASRVLAPRERGSLAARRARDDQDFSGWLLSHLKSADVGVVDLQTEEVKLTLRGYEASAPGLFDESLKNVDTFCRLSLLHRGSEGMLALPYSRESEGTKRLVDLAPMLYDLAHASPDMAMFVDEIDASLHPVLLQGILRHFNCEIALEQARGQLVFTTHETSLLDAEAKDAILRRDQVYLTEKDSSGAARLYSVAEFRERNNLNLRRRYLQGRYGALPSLGTFAE